MNAQTTSQRIIRLTILIGLWPLILFDSLGQDEKVLFESLRLGGTTVTNVVVISATPTHVMLKYNGSAMSNVKRQDLPPQLKVLYPYDAKQAEEFERKQALERQEHARKLQASQQQANQQRRVAFLQQEQVAKKRIENVEKALRDLEDQERPLWQKARGRPRSVERQQYNRLQESIKQTKEQLSKERDTLERIQKEIRQIP